MAEVLLLHHAQGLTPGVLVWAEELRTAGHVVHTPDLYDGRTFDDLEAGVAHARSLGDAVTQRAREAADALPGSLVYAGMSLGVVPAQLLAQTRPGARGAVLLHACLPPEGLGGPWPTGVPAQVHTMADDGWGDADVAREVAGRVEEVTLYLYDGDRHLFTDRSLPDHDEPAAALVLERLLALLQQVDTA